MTEATPQARLGARCVGVDDRERVDAGVGHLAHHARQRAIPAA